MSTNPKPGLTTIRRGLITLLVLFFVFLPGIAAADNDPPFVTFTGVGGRSPAQAGVSPTPFWWIDTTGRTPGADATAFGFLPFPAFQEALDTLVGGGGGSLLLTAPFRLRDRDELTVNFLLIAQRVQSLGFWASATPPEGFVLLIKGGVVVAVLENLTAAGDRFYNNERTPGISPADSNFTLPSPGVTSTTSLGSGLDVTLGSTRYFVDGGAPFCGCFVDVTTKVMPGAGVYQLVFGLYDFVEDFPGFRAALAVKSVTRVRR